jgi:hypothetical protein
VLTVDLHVVTMVRIAKNIFRHFDSGCNCDDFKMILDDCKISDLELHVSCNDTVLKLYSINSGIT